MYLKISHMTGESVVEDPQSLADVLALRVGEEQLNEFVLERDDPFPSLLIYVRGEYAYLHFVPEDGVAGFRSVGGGSLPGFGRKVKFYTGDWETRLGSEIEVLCEAVIHCSVAFRAAEEFGNNGKLPSVLKWLEL